MDTTNLLNPIDLAGRRIEQEELLDLGQGNRQEVAENLAEMQRINDILGGTRALTRHLFPRLLMHNGPVTIIDLGSGGGGLPLALVKWAHRVRLPLRVVAVDWSGRNLAIAAQWVQDFPEVQLVQADARHLPLGTGQVDYVISSLFLHHLCPESVSGVIEDAFHLASKAVIMSDLVRGWLPYLAFKLIQPVFARNYLTRHDGALSVRRAYTPEELSHLALRAGLPNTHVYQHFPWRMTLVAQK
jgi:2-polyprenyl-3-methyl-5-hydroxy-6-metoxy-1,4-benzoquinol methylase